MKFDFTTLTHDPERLNVVSTKLGATTAEKYSDTDIGKAMKMGVAGGNHSACADGDEIEGILDSIGAGGTTDGFVFGGVARGMDGVRFLATAAGAIGLKGLVVAGAQAAVGTANDGNRAVVKAGTPATFKWRVIANVTNPGNNAVANDVVVIEKL